MGRLEHLGPAPARFSAPTASCSAFGTLGRCSAPGATAPHSQRGKRARTGGARRPPRLETLACTLSAPASRGQLTTLSEVNSMTECLQKNPIVSKASERASHPANGAGAENCLSRCRRESDFALLVVPSGCRHSTSCSTNGLPPACAWPLISRQMVSYPFARAAALPIISAAPG